MQLAPEYGPDQLTGREMISGVLILGDGTRLRIRASLLTLVQWSKKLRDESGDITTAVNAYFAAHAAEFRGEAPAIIVGEGAPTEPGDPGDLYIDALTGDVFQEDV